MRISLLNVAALGLGALIALASSSSAFGNETYNRYETTNESGRRNVQIDNVRTETGTINDYDVSIKMEADKGTRNTADIRFDGTNFTGAASSSNNVPIDPVVYGTFTRTTTDSVFTDTTNVRVDEQVKFNTNVYTHSVGNN